MSVLLWLWRVTYFAVSGWMFRSASHDAAVTRQPWTRRGRTFAFSHTVWNCPRMFEASNGVPRGVGKTRSWSIQTLPAANRLGIIEDEAATPYSLDLFADQQDAMVACLRALSRRRWKTC